MKTFTKPAETAKKKLKNIQPVHKFVDRQERVGNSHLITYKNKEKALCKQSYCDSRRPQTCRNIRSYFVSCVSLSLFFWCIKIVVFLLRIIIRMINNNRVGLYAVFSLEKFWYLWSIYSFDLLENKVCKTC